MANVGIYELTDTWTNAGTTWEGIALDVTDAASGVDSRLLNLSIGSSPYLQFGKDRSLKQWESDDGAGNATWVEYKFADSDTFAIAPDYSGTNSEPTNLAFGREAASSISATNPFTAVGTRALKSNTSTGDISGFGVSALEAGSGASSHAAGDYAGYQSAGDYGSYFGGRAGYQQSAAWFTGVGYGAGENNTGTSFVGVGFEAGKDNSGTGGTFLGFRAGLSNTYNNVIAVGNGVTAFRADSAVWGGSGISEHYFSGNVGIGTGTTAPAAPLDVVGDVHINDITPQLKFIETDQADSTWRLFQTSTNFFIEPESADGSFNIRSFANQNIITVSTSGEYLDVLEAGAGSKVRLRAAGNSYFNGGNIGIGTASPSVSVDVIGSIRASSNDTDLTNKASYYLTRHYDNAEASISGIVTSNQASSNLLFLGGGSGSYNAATEIRFLTAADNTTLSGTERMRIDSTGNVGIGTTSPGRTLHVIGEGYDFRISDNAVSTSAATPLIEFYQGESTTLMGYCGFTSATDDNMEIRNSLAGNLEFWTNNTSRLTIDSTGNVGIGTTNPGGILHTLQTGTFVPGNTLTSSNSQTVFANGDGLTVGLYSGINWLRRNGVGPNGAWIAPYNEDGSANTALAFGAMGVEAMRIGSSGNVGIGTTSPTELLHVYEASAAADLLLESGNGLANLTIDGTTDSRIIFRQSGVAGFYVGQDGNEDAFKIATAALGSGSDLLTVLDTGNVGIGTASPGYDLHVDSGTASSTIAIEGSTSAIQRFINPTNTWRAFATTSDLYFEPETVEGLFRIRDTANASVVNIATSTGIVDVYEPGVGVAISLNPAGNSYLNGGNVGIGTTSPSALLEVKSSTNGSTAYNNYEGLLINNGSASLGAGNYGGGINFTRNNSQITKGSAIYPVQGDTGDADQTGLAFLVHDSATNTDPLVEAMRITYSGNVGIGTASPGNLLDVRSATASASVLIGSDDYDNNATLFLKEGILETSPSGAFVRYDGTGNRLGIGTITIADTEIEAISIARETGDVGIGTTSPTWALDIERSAAAVVRNTSTAAASWYYADAAVGFDSGYRFYEDGVLEYGLFRDANISEFRLYDYVNTTDVFRYDEATGSMSFPSGDVGIGTTSPSDTLDVVGGHLRISGVDTDATNKTSRIRTGHYTNAEEPVTLAFVNAFSTTNAINVGGGSSLENAATTIAFWTASDSTTTTGTRRLTIDSSGNVGIGTTSPTELLDVVSDAMRLRQSKTPASASATGNQGDICWDSGYIYICTATDTWKRAAIASW